ncbi:MAG: hypothetical protein C4523_07260 [Myxococcales bacterium]|nr:MAG: hypothetical protein C4523_07260 [Myxococcales bacterium]
MKAKTGLIAVLVALAGAVLLAGAGCSETTVSSSGDSDTPQFHTDGDASQEEENCPAGALGCLCGRGESCQDDLVCIEGICQEPSMPPGEEGGPCYSNGKCDAGLVCNEEDLCEAESVADGDASETDGDPPPEDGDEPVTDGDAVEEDGDSPPVDGDEAACDPIPGWPPNPETDPWYVTPPQGQGTPECSFPECDDAAEQHCYGSNEGAWKQTLTTISHTCGATAETFDQRLKPGHEEVITGLEFQTIGECDYDGEVQVGVVRGPSGIFCSISTESNGMGGTITVMETGWATQIGDRMEGQARAYLYNVPFSTSYCYADYDLLMEQE